MEDAFKPRCPLCDRIQPVRDLEAMSRHYRVCHPDQEFPPDISAARDSEYSARVALPVFRTGWCWVSNCYLPILLSTLEGLHHHYREFHYQNSTATTLSECPYPSCAEGGFLFPMTMYGHLCHSHSFLGPSGVEDHETRPPQDVLNDRGRPSSRASISSLDSMGSGDSCVSHPPRARRRRKRKVVHVPSDTGEGTRRSRSTTEESLSQPFDAGQALRGPGLIKGHRDTMYEKLSPEIQKTTGWEAQPLLMCDCCPVKPRMFVSENELRAHTAEKQYKCAYCGIRFKNKNESERHQNSVHLDRYAWSCSTLSVFDNVFHNSPTGPDSWDVCGYCGLEFPRSGKGIGQSAINHVDWAKRLYHLREVHRFGECNSSKKFFREDHFRQHLKHCHAGTRGKWTDALTNACMTKEKALVAVTEGAETSGRPLNSIRSV